MFLLMSFLSVVCCGCCKGRSNELEASLGHGPDWLEQIIAYSCNSGVAECCNSFGLE
jgi:hypothetical protein